MDFISAGGEKLDAGFNLPDQAVLVGEMTSETAISGRTSS
jgi:hypothetical protein